MTHTHKKIEVCLLDADGGLGLQAVHTLNKAQAYAPTALSPFVPNALRYSRCCRFVHLEGWDWQGGAGDLHRHTGAGNGRILLPVTTSAVKWIAARTAELSTEWRLPPLPEPAALATVLSKSLFSQYLHMQGFLTAPSCPLPDVLAGNAEAEFPALIKPAVGSGGKGIVKVDTYNDLVREAAGIGHPHKYIVQKYIEGEDVSYGVLCRHGAVQAAVGYRCLSRHQTYGPFKSIELIDDAPTYLTVEQLMRTLEWNGIANIDLRIGKDGGIYLLEVNPRMWANMRSVLISGHNFAGSMCLSALGAPIPPVEVRKGTFFNPSGILALGMRRLRRREQLPFRWRHTTLPYIIKDPASYLFLLVQRLRANGFLSFKRVWQSVVCGR